MGQSCVGERREEKRRNRCNPNLVSCKTETASFQTYPIPYAHSREAPEDIVNPVFRNGFFAPPNDSLSFLIPLPPRNFDPFSLSLSSSWNFSWYVKSIPPTTIFTANFGPSSVRNSGSSPILCFLHQLGFFRRVSYQKYVEYECHDLSLLWFWFWFWWFGWFIHPAMRNSIFCIFCLRFEKIVKFRVVCNGFDFFFYSYWEIVDGSRKGASESDYLFDLKFLLQGC